MAIDEYLRSEVERMTVEAIGPLVDALHALAARLDRVNVRVDNLTRAYQTKPVAEVTLRDRRGAMWAPEEDAVLRRYYPRHGSGRVRIELAAVGCKRSVQSVYTRAKNLGVESLTARDAVLDLVRDFRGVPLSAVDVSDELGMSRGRAKALLGELVTDGLLVVSGDGQQWAVALEEAA